MTGGELSRIREQRLYRELLHAMERARTRLAVAIATEHKATRREQWDHYLATAERMRNCVREIRQRRIPGTAMQTGWFHALDLLRQPLPDGEDESTGEAGRLCRRLHDVMRVLSDEY